MGYSENSKKGSGIGPKLAKKLTQTAYELIKAGIKDPEVFHLVGLLEEGIGADRISDITVAILLDDFLTYTQNVSLALKIKTDKFSYNKIDYEIPFYQDNPIIFCPKSLLTDLPIVFDLEEIRNDYSYN